MQSLAERLTQVCQRIHVAEAKFNRPQGSVQLLAVSKTQPSSVSREAFQLGQQHFGENYPQEALSKIQDFDSLPLHWHFIGRIQSNKTRVIAENFTWAHSLTRTKIATRLSDQRPENFKPLNVCIQVNIENEASKDGASLAQLPALAEHITALPNLHLRGLMSIPIAHSSFDEQRAIYAKLRLAQEDLKRRGFNLDTLSMGMSNDFEAAIAETRLCR